MADDRENRKEDQRGSDKTKSNVNENLLSTSKAKNLQKAQRRRDEKRSRSIDETKGRILDPRRSKSETWSNKRHEIHSRSNAEKQDQEDSGLRTNKTGQFLYYRDSSKGNPRENKKQQRLSEVEMKRRRYETESRFWNEEMDRLPDRRRSESRFRYDESPWDYRRNEPEWREYERTPLDYRRNEPERRGYERTLLEYRGNESELREYERPPLEYRGHGSELREYEKPPLEYRGNESERRGYERAPMEYRGNESEWRYDERTQRRYERLPSGAYIVHPGKDDCNSYFRTGTCPNRRTCKFNHPAQLPQEVPERTPVGVCKYFAKGRCKKGSGCLFRHIMNRDGSLKQPMPQTSSMDRGASESDERSTDRRASENVSIAERRYETKSGYRPEKRSRTIPNSRLRDSRGTFDDIPQRRDEIEQEKKESPENRFMAAQRAREKREAEGNNAGERIINYSHLIEPIANAILRERRIKREMEMLSKEESPDRSSQQSNSTK